jgi:membrane protease YdiL (CAAX protease family)
MRSGIFTGEVSFSAESLAFMAVFTVVLMFFLYWYTAGEKILLNTFVKPLFPSRSIETIEYISYKLTGILFTGLIPLVIFVLIIDVSPSRIGLVIGRTFKFWYLLVALITITALVSFQLSKGGKVQEKSPELKIRDWFPRHIVLSVSAWLFYILGYEFLFRGVLWFLCSEAFGFWPALIINILLYSLVHLPQGRFIAIGAIPLGIILCILSHLTGSFLPAFIVHSCVAVFTDLFSLFHNPGVHLHLSRRE